MQQRAPSRASVLETVLLATTVFLPTAAQGTILRHPRMVRLAAGCDTNRRASHTLARLRRRHGEGPVSVSVLVPGRRVLLLLSPQDARRMVNEAVLDWDARAHRRFPALTPRIHEEAQALLTLVRGSGRPLHWEDFSAAFRRIIRRIVLGDAARDDHRLTELLDRLRADANWLTPRRPKERIRDAFLARLRAYADSAEPDSLAALVAATPRPESAEPIGQIAHWLFAYDAISLATYSALALLASHPEHAHRVHTELDETDPVADPAQPATAGALPLLRACVLESLRLWPTPPAIHRDTTAETTWHNGTTTPAATTVVLYRPFFHRDPQHLTHADRFEPDAWLDSRNDDNWALAPLNHSPAQHPGQDLVLFTAATLLAALLRNHKALLLLPRRPLAPPLPLPHTVDHTSFRFALTPK